MSSSSIDLGQSPRSLARHSGAHLGGWAPLGYLSLYRVVVAALFVMLASLEAAPRPLGSYNPALFFYVVSAYLVFAIGAGLGVHRRWLNLELHLLLTTTLDIVALSMMMLASGGVQSGFGMLLVVAVAGGSILSRRRIALMFASLASLAVLIQQAVLAADWWVPISDYTHGGMLGLGFFATAALAHLSAQRIRVSETLAAQHAVDLANLGQLNEHIIQRMQSGVMVVDPDGYVPLANKAATALLGFDHDTSGLALSVVAPGVEALLVRWRAADERSTYVLPSAATGGDVVVSFAALRSRKSAGVVVFLEDASAMYQRAQQLKLVSLGRLTASIAHEIRNPLSAISHAGELLSENTDLPRSEMRLTEIINVNALRVNEIIENILQLSRRSEARPQFLELGPWLRQFVDEFSAGAPAHQGQIDLQFSLEPGAVQFDPGQLRQVMSNLCENGLRHSDGAGVVLTAYSSVEERRPYLDIQDFGAGIALADVASVFEPFFTTRSEGTGLGLYIARELCEGNQATLALVPCATGALFRLHFADPRRDISDFTSTRARGFAGDYRDEPSAVGN